MLNDYLDQRIRFFKHFYFKPGRNRLPIDSFIQNYLVNVKTWTHGECRNEWRRRSTCPHGAVSVTRSCENTELGKRKLGVLLLYSRIMDTLDVFVLILRWGHLIRMYLVRIRRRIPTPNIFRNCKYLYFHSLSTYVIWFPFSALLQFQFTP